MRINPLLGEAEAEGFGVGVGIEEPAPALRSTPTRRGYSQAAIKLLCKIQVLHRMTLTNKNTGHYVRFPDANGAAVAPH